MGFDMKKRIIKALIAISSIIVLINVIQFARPLLRSNEKVESDMLKLMPIGTSMEDAIKIIQSRNKWFIPTSRGPLPWSSLSDALKSDMIERGLIKLSIKDNGHPLYYDFFQVSVVLRFDDDFKLIEVDVSQFLLI